MTCTDLIMATHTFPASANAKMRNTVTRLNSSPMALSCYYILSSKELVYYVSFVADNIITTCVGGYDIDIVSVV